MSQQNAIYAATMFAAGIGIPILAALNAQLGRSLQSPWMAAVVLFSVALVAAVAVLLVTGGARPLAALAGQPKHLYLGGLLVAFYVLSVTVIAPRFGLGNAIVLVLMGQLASASVIDHFGLFGAIQREMNGTRLAGLAAMLAGVLLTQRY
jgi:transporter family-2 protein